MSKKDAYDQLLMNFTFSQLLESVDVFLDTFSLERSSVFLIEVWGLFCYAYNKTDPLYGKLSVICVLHPVGKRLPPLMGFIDCGFSVVTVYTGNLFNDFFS